MRTTRTAIAAILLVTLTLGSSGCQSMQDASPETHVANARSIYIACVQAATALGNADVLDVEVLEQFNEVRIRAYGLLEEADAAVAAGADFNFADLTATIASLLFRSGDRSRRNSGG